MQKKIMALLISFIMTFGVTAFASDASDEGSLSAMNPVERMFHLNKKAEDANNAVLREAAGVQNNATAVESDSMSGIDAGAYVQARKGLQNKIPALMYHKVTDNPAEVTEWVVTGKMLADDFAEIKARGYTPITVSEFYNIRKLSENLFDDANYKVVADFFKNNPKPIIITFDDGYKGIYTHTLPLMKEYNFKVNFYICGELIDNQNPEYCTWEEIKELNASGLAEIGNHTYSLHSKSKADLNFVYQGQFEFALADINKNREVIAANTGIDSRVFSFPYGLYDHTVLARLSNAGYQAFVSTDYRVNMIKDKSATLGRFNRDTNFTTKQFFDLVDSKCK